MEILERLKLLLSAIL